MASAPEPGGLAAEHGAAAEDDLDRMPLIKRKRMLRLSADGPPPSPFRHRSPVDVAAKRVSLEGLQDWPGLPRGVKFDPTDEELLWHLLAKVGKGDAEPHPFINAFIISLGENDRIACTHPQELPGVKQDGSISYFFHKAFKVDNRSSRKRQKLNNEGVLGVCWQEVGNTEPVIVDGIHEGCKKILVPHIRLLNDVEHKKTNWVMHSYHLGAGDAKEGEIVVSKVFYQQSTQESDKNRYELPLQSTRTVVGGVKPVSGLDEVGSGPQNRHSDLISIPASDQAAAVACQNIHKDYSPSATPATLACATPAMLANNGAGQTEYLIKVKIEPEFIVNSKQLANDSTNVALLQKHSCSNCCDVEKRILCTLSCNQVSSEVLKVELEQCQLATEDVLPGLSKNDLVKEIDESSFCRSHGENHYTDSQSAPVEFHMGGAEKDTLKSISTSGFRFQDNKIIRNPSVTGQFSPSLVVHQNHDSWEHKYSQEKVSSNQISVVESIQREENACVNGSSQPTSTVESLEEVKVETTEEGCVNNNAELSVTLDSDADRLCLPTKYQAASLCSSNEKICQDNFFSMTSKLEKNQEFNCKYPAEVFGSEANLSHIGLGQSLTYLNGEIQDLNLAASTCFKVKSEPLGEKCTNICEAIAPSLHPSLVDCSSENTCNVAQCMPEVNYILYNCEFGVRVSQENPARIHVFCKKAALSEDLQLDLNASNINATSISDLWNSSAAAAPDDSCLATQCSTEADGVDASIVPTGSNLNETKGAISFDQTSLRQELCHNSTNHLPELDLSSLPIRVKEEELESGSLCNPGRKPPVSFRDFDKSEDVVKRELLYELSEDGLDDVPLIARLKMPIANSDSNLYSSNNIEHLQQASLDAPKLDTVNSKSSHFSLRRKRKKTATDSVETALQEDAPGLLQVLLDKGITIDEIKLYQNMEDDDAMEVSPTEENFEELETVISKSFWERSSLFKFPSLRIMKGSKAVYCLACLISLIEQTRYLRFRDSPVEWGWCRDLQSFIFVFERHNRIVLERPEYGYATYFFELVESLPIDWQIKRLVTAMKLSSCGRTTLIENRSLLIGQDMSEGEARVLEAYGWEPNTGLGTMLNYCGRVMHDKKNERYSSEWRAKIGKLLMAGHDAGRTVSTIVPKKVVEYMGGKIPEIQQGAHKTLEYAGFQNSEIKLQT